MREPPKIRHDQHSASDSATAMTFLFSVNPIIALLPYSSFLLRSAHCLPTFSITVEFYKPNRYFPFSDVSAGSHSLDFATIRPLSSNFLVHGGTVQIQPLLSLSRYSGYLFIVYFCDSLSVYYQPGLFVPQEIMLIL